MANLMEEVHLTTIKPKNNVLLLAQEISFAKVLACNDKRLRDRGVRRLKKWFMARSQGSMEFTREDLMRIWKGLFYCMWMSDKPLIQEELAEEISQLIHSFVTFKASLLFVETFFTSLSIEWFGIDQLRLDKFMMLVRRFLRQSLELVARLDWATESVQKLADVYHQTLTSAPMGLSMHFIEIFCEELAKIGKGELSNDTILQFIKPFAHVMATLKDGRLISQITKYVFLHLIRQTELGIEYQMKFSVWKEYGFPGGDVDAAEKIEVDSENDEDEESDSEREDVEEREIGVDARAGKVDVLLPPLDFDPRDLLKTLRELRNKKETTTKARKTLIQLIAKYENLAAGKYPLGLHKVELPEKTNKKKEILKAAKRLYEVEQKLMESDSDSEENGETQAKLRKTAGKKKKRLMKSKKSVWEVSKTGDNVNQSESGSNASWDISDSGSNKASSYSKENKLKESSVTEDDAINKAKAAKSYFSVRKSKKNNISLTESKENSFLSPVASTPKKIKSTNSVLKKTTANDQNITDNNSLTPSDNVCRRTKNNKLIKRATLKFDKDDANELSKIEDANNTGETLTTNLNTPNLTEESISSEIQLNTSEAGKNNGWGGEWDEPLKEGEYELFIPNKKYVEKRKSLGLSYPVSSFVQKSSDKVTPLKKVKAEMKRRLSTPGSLKKVEFNLKANCSQDYKEYTKKLRSSKTHVPFDATKKPVQGLLKTSTPSPINPFYKKKLKLLNSSVEA